MNKGVKYDNDKPRWGLLPYKQVEQIVDVLTFGSKKYSDDNWKKVPNAEERYFDAMLRHITEYRYGDKSDTETTKSHLAHAMCCALFLMWFDDNPDAERFFDDDVEKDDISFDLKPDDIENYYFMGVDASLKLISDNIKKGVVDLKTWVQVNIKRDENGTYYEYVGKNSPHFKFKEHDGELEFYIPPADIVPQLSVEDMFNLIKPLKENDGIYPTRMNPLNNLIGRGVASLTTEPNPMQDIIKSLDETILDIENGNTTCPSVDTIPKSNASLTTEPNQEPSCCYSNMGNVKTKLCTPEEILRCLQKSCDDAGHVGNSWFKPNTMKCMHGANQYAYIGKNSTANFFFFELVDNKFKRIYNND